MKEEEKKKKCNLILDHNPEWGGDGFYCQHCGVEFVPISSERQRLREEIDFFAQHCKDKKPQHKCSACVVLEDLKLKLLEDNKLTPRPEVW